MHRCTHKGICLCGYMRELWHQTNKSHRNPTNNQDTQTHTLAQTLTGAHTQDPCRWLMPELSYRFSYIVVSCLALSWIFTLVSLLSFFFYGIDKDILSVDLSSDLGDCQVPFAPPSLFFLDSPCAFLSQALSFTYTVWKNRQNPFAKLRKVKHEAV